MNLRNFTRKDIKRCVSLCVRVVGYGSMDWRDQEISGNLFIFASKSEKRAGVLQLF